MLLNDAVKLGYCVERERVSAIIYIMVFPYFCSTEQPADHIRETFDWHLRGAACPPRPLPENYHDLCPNFDFAVAEEATRNFRFPYVVQAVFYAMVVNMAFKMGVLSRDLAEHLKSALEGLRWYMCEAWLQLDKHAFLWVNPGARPGPASDQEENSGTSDAPPPPSDDE
ncbi:hypothetical protein Cgig2_003877 [Carnegiea gigantea]|uniref:Uncharacterized protein n=1 Tax=Carnegiea gigantea TaxID=171969 RepID=A0A9Q1GS31_9CARY|nr:hypothetical protein Cgig2_003877 [Carnegiea gigantea]